MKTGLWIVVGIIAVVAIIYLINRYRMPPETEHPNCPDGCSYVAPTSSSEAYCKCPIRIPKAERLVNKNPTITTVISNGNPSGTPNG